MTYVITEPCIGVKDNSCVEVCPVDCIHSDESAEQFFIDPEECIDCAACVDTCPVSAIFAGDEVPEDQERFVALNAAYFERNGSS
jgi:ferredoxin